MGRLRPLLLRPGLRHRCFGDGLCCSDFHVIAPLSGREVKALQQWGGEEVADCFAGMGYIDLEETGECALLREGRCTIHAEPIKPRVCDRFPYTLVGTPKGGRVAIEHRCTCMNHGEAPLVDEAMAERDLLDAAGRLKANHKLEQVALRTGTLIDFEAYEAEEAKLLSALEGDVKEALDRAPFLPLREATWEEVGLAFVNQNGDVRLHEALRWVGDAILQGNQRAGRRSRPWAEAIERTALRQDETNRDDRLRRWIADTVWSLCWTAYCSYEQLLRELATRLELVDRTERRLRRHSPLPFVEALMLVDFVGTSEWWEGVAGRLEDSCG